MVGASVNAFAAIIVCGCGTVAGRVAAGVVSVKAHVRGRDVMSFACFRGMLLLFRCRCFGTARFGSSVSVHQHW